MAIKKKKNTASAAPEEAPEEDEEADDYAIVKGWAVRTVDNKKASGSFGMKDGSTCFTWDDGDRWVPPSEVSFVLETPVRDKKKEKGCASTGNGTTGCEEGAKKFRHMKSKGGNGKGGDTDKSSGMGNSKP
eukprot:3003736-Pyramimonas_sp.AAC.1